MRRTEAAAVVVVLGLTLVGFSAAPQRANVVSTPAQWLVLAAAVALVLASLPLARVSGRAGAGVLGAEGGLAFGVVAVAARALSASVASGPLSADVHVLIRAPAPLALTWSAPGGDLADQGRPGLGRCPFYQPFTPRSPRGHYYELARTVAHHPPRVSLWMETSHADVLSYSSSAQFLRATRQPTAVHAVVLQNAGHRAPVWVALEPAALRWLGRNVAGVPSPGGADGTA